MFNIDITQALNTLSIAAVPALLGIILHEVAHGWVAARCGDPTARMMGRLTLNPLPHIDPMGLMVFGLTSLSGSIVFGWAKPVPVNPRYFRDPAKGMMLVALAGPLTNFILAGIFGVLLRLTLNFFPPIEWQYSNFYIFALKSMQAGVVINFGLGWLNLLPIPPLDGSRIVAWLLPESLAEKYLALERYGLLILLLLLATGLAGMFIQPAYRIFRSILL